MEKLKRLSRNKLKGITGGVCSSWINVTASCGASYGLCADNYKNDFEKLNKTVKELDKIKC